MKFSSIRSRSTGLMATSGKSFHHYDQILPQSKQRSQSSDPISIHFEKNSNKQKLKMKKSETTLNNIEGKSSSTLASLFNSASPLRRRLSFFRAKRSQTNSTEALQQMVERLRYDLQLKTDELEAWKSSPWLCSSIEQWQSRVNRKFEKLAIENNMLRRNIQELETFIQQETSKKKNEIVLRYWNDRNHQFFSLVDIE